MNVSRTGLKKINEIISSKTFIEKVAPVLAHLPLSKTQKNIIRAKIEAAKGIADVKSYPYRMVINITNHCNLRCSFCEITYFHEKYPVHYDNTINAATFKKFESVMKNLYTLEFFGNVGEPLMNFGFNDIMRYIKKNFGTRIFVNTNGTLLTAATSSLIVEYGLDEVLVSLHAGTEETYKKLIGNTFHQVLENIKTLTAFKTQRGAEKPEIGIAFALNQINAVDIEDIIELTAKVKADYLQVSHYYDVRNKLGEDISYRRQPQCGNAMLDWLYKYAEAYSFFKNKKIKLIPKSPPYLPTETESQTGKPQGCDMPWSTVRFDGCIEYENSHYVSVCSRIYLFRIDYTEFDFNEFNKLWNHPYIQYMRKTVNSNPICRFCKNPETPGLRNVDNEEYRKQRDEAIESFFKQAADHATTTIPEIKGIYILRENPYS
jgi:MoaA/NifB/PqqE/SkfB family radical SAM enzyme